MKINRELAERVLAIVDAGLTQGMGRPEPGHMCVEAAVCFALGLPHSDQPTPCVDPDVITYKIALNDNGLWKDEADRAAGLRGIALAQLGSAGLAPRAFSDLVYAKSGGKLVCYCCNCTVSHLLFTRTTKEAVQIGIDALRELGSPGIQWMDELCK